MGAKKYRVRVTDANGQVIFVGTFEEDDGDKVARRAEEEFSKKNPHYRSPVPGSLTFDIEGVS